MVLFIVLVIAAFLTFVVPAGTYDRLSYDGEANSFIVESYGGEISTLDATQEELDALGVTIPLENFNSCPNNYFNLYL